jgi:hypothetical protein
VPGFYTKQFSKEFFMTKQHALSLMMRHENHVVEADLYTVAALMAETIADVSDQLDDRQVDRFINIGAAIYRHGLNEFKEGVEVEDLFPAKDNWPNGRPRGAGGFRKDE